MLIATKNKQTKCIHNYYSQDFNTTIAMKIFDIMKLRGLRF